MERGGEVLDGGIAGALGDLGDGQVGAGGGLGSDIGVEVFAVGFLGGGNVIGDGGILTLGQVELGVGGGGQPFGITDALRNKRRSGLVQDDRQSLQRCSHQNPSIQALYKDYLGHPLSEKAHKLLHTSYEARKIYKK